MAASTSSSSLDVSAENYSSAVDNVMEETCSSEPERVFSLLQVELGIRYLLLVAVGAAGISLPLMVAFDHQRLRPEWAKGEVAGTF